MMAQIPPAAAPSPDTSDSTATTPTKRGRGKAKAKNANSSSPEASGAGDPSSAEKGTKGYYYLIINKFILSRINSYF